MEEIKLGKHVTAMDLAKVLGIEKEYREAIFEEELKENYKNIMSEDVDVKDDKNDAIT